MKKYFIDKSRDTVYQYRASQIIEDLGKNRFYGWTDQFTLDDCLPIKTKLFHVIPLAMNLATNDMLYVGTNASMGETVVLVFKNGNEWTCPVDATQLIDLLNNYERYLETKRYELK